MIQEAFDSLEELLVTHQPNGMDKIQSKLVDVKQIDQRMFFYLFALCTRWFEDRNAEIQSSSHWMEKDVFGVLSQWQWPGVARLYLLLLLEQRNTKENFIKLYATLFDSADVKESIHLVQSLAFLPHPEAFAEKARVAARSNITPLFSAVAHNSDYAFKHFDESGWNQLVLKAAFLGESIIGIYGLKSRNNASLVDMLSDYARERQAASRSVPWDLWCCIAWMAQTGDDCDFLETIFSNGDIKTKAAITLALSENPSESVTALTQQCLQDDELQALSRSLTWESIRKLQV